MAQAKLLKSRNFEYLDFPSQGEPDYTLVIFHGYGADAYDLSGLSRELNLAKDFRWVFPNGPLQVPIGPGFYGRAWMQLRREALDAMFTGQSLDFSEQQAPEMPELREKVLSFLKGLGADPNKLVIGGFSQGAMLSMDVSLHMDQPPAALILLSGNAMDLPNLRLKAAKLQQVPIFQSHGRNDTILGIQGARKLQQELQKCGVRVDMHEFSGGHEIPASVLRALEQFLNRLA